MKVFRTDFQPVTIVLATKEELKLMQDIVALDVTIPKAGAKSQEESMRTFLGKLQRGLTE